MSSITTIIKCQDLEGSLQTIANCNEMQMGEREILCIDRKSTECTIGSDFIEVRFRQGKVDDISRIASFCHANIVTSEEEQNVVSKNTEDCDDNDIAEKPCSVAEHMIPEQIEQLLLSGFGEESLSAAMHVLLCEVRFISSANSESAAAFVNSCTSTSRISVDHDIQGKDISLGRLKDFNSDEENSINWLLGGVAIMSEDWDAASKNRILQTEFLHVSNIWKHYGLKRRLLLRLTVLSIASGCNNLVLKNGGI